MWSFPDLIGDISCITPRFFSFRELLLSFPRFFSSYYEMRRESIRKKKRHWQQQHKQTHSYTDAKTVVRCSEVCTALYSLAHDEALWKRLYCRDFSSSFNHLGLILPSKTDQLSSSPLRNQVGCHLNHTISTLYVKPDHHHLDLMAWLVC